MNEARPFSESFLPDVPWRWLAPALVIPLGGALVYFVWWVASPVAKLIYAGTKVFEAAYPILVTRRCDPHALRRIPFLPPREKSGHRSWRRPVVEGIVSGLLICGMIGGMMALPPLRELVFGAAPHVRDKAASLGLIDHFIPFAVFLSLGHSLLEEFYWRWFVFGGLRGRMPAPAAHFVAGVAFAAHHLVVTLAYFPLAFAIFLAAGVAIGGVLWNIFLVRHRCLLGAWISHLAVDIALMTVGWFLLKASS